MSIKEQFKKQQAKRKSTSGIRRLTKNENSAKVRFLYPMAGEDADCGWAGIYEVFDVNAKRSFYYEEEEDQPEHVEGKIKPAYFGVGYDVDTREVGVWQIKPTLFKILDGFDDAYGTITDRPYLITRKGEGLETEYQAFPLDKEDITEEMYEARANSKELLADKMEWLLSQTS